MAQRDAETGRSECIDTDAPGVGRHVRALWCVDRVEVLPTFEQGESKVSLEISLAQRARPNTEKGLKDLRPWGQYLG